MGYLALFIGGPADGEVLVRRTGVPEDIVEFPSVMNHGEPPRKKVYVQTFTPVITAYYWERLAKEMGHEPFLLVFYKYLGEVVERSGSSEG